MTIEISHGKARPTLPRASDLERMPGAAPPAEPAPIRGKRGTPRGGARLAAGSTPSPAAEIQDMARGKGDKGVLTIPDEDAAALAEDAQVMHAALMRDVGPCAALAVVQAMGVRAARWFALAAYFGTKADEVGPATEWGIRLIEKEALCCQRAERCSVTMLDFARVFGRTSAAGNEGEDADEIARRAEEDAERRRAERRSATVDAVGESA